MTPDHPTVEHPTALLPGFVLADLDALEVQAVEVHLLSCAACREEVAALRDALFGLTDTLPAAPVPPAAWEKLQAKRERAQAQPVNLPLPPRRRSPLLWPLVAALCGGLLVGGLGMRSHLAGRQQATLQNLMAAGAQPLKLVNAQGQAFGTVLLLKDMQAVVLLDRQPPAGMVYQVWGRPKAQGGVVKPVSLGMTDGTQLNVIRCNSYEFVGVSLEPSGGNAAPTKPLGRAKIPTRGT